MNNNRGQEEDVLIGNNDIRYIDVYQFFFRNSRKLIKFLSIGLGFSFIYVLIQKNVWQGEFQIVLENSSNQSNLLQSIENNFDFQLGQETPSNINTEVEILKSPSVLMPIYKSSILRDKSHTNNNKTISFRSWKRNLDIKLAKGTSVLNIKYKNKNKKSILPILNDISEVYQKYSTNNVDKNLENGINYLNNQIEFYRKKGNNSYLNLQKFALEHDLKINKNENRMIRSSISSETSSPVSNFQDERSSAAMEKRLLYQLAEYFQGEKTDNERLTYLAKNNELVDEETLENLQKLQNKINASKTLFTSNYSKTKELEDAKEILLSFIKESSLKMILAKIDAADAIIKSSERPEGVYVKFNSLNNKYLRDRYTLNNLEAELRALNLERAKEIEPYKLITIPTLLDQKIAPSRSRILIYLILLSLFISILYIYIEEKIKDYIYSTKDLVSLIPFKLIEKIPSNFLNDWDHQLDVISNLYLKDKVIIEIIKLGDIDEKLLETFTSKMKKKNPNKDIRILKNIAQMNNKNPQLLLIQSGKVKNEEVENFKRRFNNAGLSIMGWILFEEIITFNKTKFDN